MNKLRTAESVQELVERPVGSRKVLHDRKILKLKGMFEKGYSDDEIGQELGWKKDTVIHYRSKFKLLRKKESYVTLNPDKLDELLEKITNSNDHMPRWEIAEKINASHRLWRCISNKRCKGLQKWQFEKLSELAGIPFKTAIQIYALHETP